MYGAGAVLGLAWPGSSAPLASVCLVSRISPVSSIYVFICAQYPRACCMLSHSTSAGWPVPGHEICNDISRVQLCSCPHAGPTTTTKHGWISKIIKNHQPHVKLTNKIDGRYTPLLIILFTPSFAGRVKGLDLIGNYSGVEISYVEMWPCCAWRNATQPSTELREILH